MAGTACLSTKIKMATLREVVADLGCCSVSRDSRHLGLQAIVLSVEIPLAKWADVSKVVNRNRRPRELFIFFFFFLLSVSLALS